MLEPVLYNVFLSDPGKPEYSQVRKPVMLLRAPMDELQRDLTATRRTGRRTPLSLPTGRWFHTGQQPQQPRMHTNGLSPCYDRKEVREDAPKAVQGPLYDELLARI